MEPRRPSQTSEDEEIEDDEMESLLNRSHQSTNALDGSESAAQLLKKRRKYRILQLTVSVLVFGLAISAVVIYNEGLKSSVTDLVYDAVLIAINAVALIALVSLVLDTVPFEKGTRAQRAAGEYTGREYDRFHPTVDTCVMWVLAGLDALYSLLLITAKLRLDSDWHAVLSSGLYVLVDVCQVVVVTSLMHERRVLREKPLFAPILAPILLPTNIYHFVIDAFFSSQNVNIIATSAILPSTAVTFVEVVLFMAVVSYRLLAFCEILTIVRRFDASVRHRGRWVDDPEETRDEALRKRSDEASVVAFTPGSTGRQVARCQQEMRRVARVEECWWMNIAVLLLLVLPLYTSFTCLVNDGNAEFIQYCAAYRWLSAVFLLLNAGSVLAILPLAPTVVRSKCSFRYFGKDEIIVIVCYLASIAMRVVHSIASGIHYSSEGESDGALSLSAHIGDIALCCAAILADTLQTYLLVTAVEGKRCLDIQRLAGSDSKVERSKVHLPKCMTAFNMAMLCVTVAEEMTPLYSRYVVDWPCGPFLIGVLFPLFIDFRFHSSLLLLGLHNDFQKSLQSFYRNDEIYVEQLQKAMEETAAASTRQATIGPRAGGQEVHRRAVN